MDAAVFDGSTLRPGHEAAEAVVVGRTVSFRNAFDWLVAKTLGAKRRISSSEIATVPGTVDLVESRRCNSVVNIADLSAASVTER
jgi:hypothetical protein